MIAASDDHPLDHQVRELLNQMLVQAPDVNTVVDVLRNHLDMIDIDASSATAELKVIVDLMGALASRPLDLQTRNQIADLKLRAEYKAKHWISRHPESI
jgi:hypothetical protein